MIKVTVLYSNTPGARFDVTYYREKHMPLVKARMGDACKGWSVDHGIAGFPPGTPAPYICMGHLLADSVESFMAAFGPHVPEFQADGANYTNVMPSVQVSEVVAG